MKQEIRAHIDQIRQGIVPEGYKKTESGIIPNEWRVGQVGKCIEEYKFFSNDISHIPVYSSSRKGLVPQSGYYNQREAVETNLGYKVVPQGYVTYRHMSDDDVFHFNINKTGENVLVSSEYPVFTSSDNCDLSFLISVLNNTARFRYFCKMQKLGGTRTRLYLNNLKRYALALPPFDEQKKIAEILSTQDKAIELQGRKIEELKRFKKGCLEKMFPRKGQKVPEKRFPGFTDDWEQRKLGEVVEITSGFMGDSLLSDGKYHLTRIETIADGIVDESRVGYSNKKPDDMYLLRYGDILYSNINSISHMGKVAKYKGISPLYHGINLLRLRPERNINSDFLLCLLNSDKCRNWAKTRANQAVSQASINQSLLETQEIAIISIEEQKKIGAYFENLDNLITLHQRKLEEMKRQKKALMQLLLTGIVRV